MWAGRRASHDLTRVRSARRSDAHAAHGAPVSRSAAGERRARGAGPAYAGRVGGAGRGAGIRSRLARGLRAPRRATSARDRAVEKEIPRRLLLYARKKRDKQHTQNRKTTKQTTQRTGLVQLQIVRVRWQSRECASAGPLPGMAPRPLASEERPAAPHEAIPAPARKRPNLPSTMKAAHATERARSFERASPERRADNSQSPANPLSPLILDRKPRHTSNHARRRRRAAPPPSSDT